MTGEAYLKLHPVFNENNISSSIIGLLGSSSASLPRGLVILNLFVHTCRKDGVPHLGVLIMHSLVLSLELTVLQFNIQCAL